MMLREGTSLWDPCLRLNLIISVSYLVKSLDRICSSVLGYPLSVLSRGPQIGNLFVDHLISGGWCPNHVENISYLDISELWAASTLPSHDMRDHIGCSALKCVEKPGPMPSRAAGCSGSCETVSVGEVDLVQILEGGLIPVLQLITNNGPLAVHLVGFESNLSYVAISHVW